MKTETRSVWPRVLGYFLVAMVALTLLSRAADSLMLPVVKCARPLPGALKHQVVAQGVIEARELWPVMAEPELPVARVHVKAGQQVKAGDIIITYDGDALRRKLDQKQAALKKLTLQAQLDGQEPSPTADNKAADQGKAALKQQIARLDTDAAQWEADRLAALYYAGAALVAPVDGTVSELLVKPGDMVSGAAARLAPAASGLVVRLAITQEQAKHLVPGMGASYQPTGDTRPSQGGVLLGVAPTATGYEASVELPTGAGAIGQAVTVTLTQETETYDMRVPLSAIVDGGGPKGVYRIRAGQGVLGDMEYAEYVPVEVMQTDGQYAAISAMLNNRDQVIVSFSKPLTAGDRVRSAS